jgi:hypothetical protein
MVTVPIGKERNPAERSHSLFLFFYSDTTAGGKTDYQSQNNRQKEIFPEHPCPPPDDS